jgi:hypothetical protein
LVDWYYTGKYNFDTKSGGRVEMITPKNHDILHFISDEVCTELDRLEEEGESYYSDRSVEVAAFVIQHWMPDLPKMTNERVVVESKRGISVLGDRSLSYGDLMVNGIFKAVSIQQLHEVVGGEVTLTTNDLCAVITPTYQDSDPLEIITGQQLIVPFHAIDKFEIAA